MTWKLIRDKLPERARARGEELVCHTANLAEFRHHLRKKLAEEVREYLEGESPEELADILEVVRAIAGEKGITMRTLYKLRDRKCKERGGFGGRVIWEGVTRPVVANFVTTN